MSLMLWKFRGCALSQASRILVRAPRKLSVAAGGTSKLIEISEERFDEMVRHEMAYFASVPEKSVSIRQILDATPEELAQVCWKEGPKRLALRIRLLESLVGWQNVKELVQMHDMLNRWYRSLSLSERNIKSMAECIRAIRKDGQQVIPLVSSGIHKLQSRFPEHFETETLDRWLDSFFLSRISTNVLADQLLARVSVRDGGEGKPTGIINPKCDAVRLCEESATFAAKLCYHQTGIRPLWSVENYEANSMEPVDIPCFFSYIPSYLRYMMVELLKNSFKATAERFGNEEEVSKRPVHIRVCHDSQRVAILVSDRAGGIPFDVGDNIWSYMYGACARSSDSAAVASASPLGGYGVGLPLSRLYARYLGGKLHVTSYPGYGTQAHLLLPRIAVDQIETFRA